jgi:pimeloyl-ACP methyl ester carboxylesterase
MAAVRGIRIYYEDVGRGPVLVLLHGGAGSGEQFKPQIPFFSKHRRLIIPDACAQGRTTDREGPLTYHSMAEDLVALLDHLRIRRADVLGWSDGGVVGLDVAMNHPGRIRRLVAFGANFSPDGLNAPDVLWNNTATAASFGPDMEKFYKSVAPDTSHYVAAMEKVIRLWREEPNYTAEELGKIRCRTLIAAGEHDVIREDHTRELARRIPGATLWIVPKASHSVLQEAPGEVNPVILKFLGSGLRKPGGGAKTK